MPLNVVFSRPQNRCRLRVKLKGSKRSGIPIDAAFLLTVGGFLLAVELLCSQLCFGAF